MKQYIFFLIISIIILFSSCNSNRYSQSLLDYNPDLNNISFRQNHWTNNEGFSFAIIPDPQKYTDLDSQTFSPFPYVIDQWKIYYRQTEFIAQNSVQNGGDFSFALHVGDHVEHQNWKPFEWDLAVKCFENLNGQIPVLTVPGNHDCDIWVGPSHQNESFQSYNKYFGPDTAFFKDKDWYKGSSQEGRNSWAIFNAAGKDILVIGLELNPDDYSIQWAQDILDNNKNLPAIILTHAYLSSAQGIDDDNDNVDEYEDEDEEKKEKPKKKLTFKKITFKKNKKKEEYIPGINNKFNKSDYRKKFDGWLPKKMWKNFVSNNDQIFLVVSGHVCTEEKPCGFRIDKNDNGYTTYSIYSNFQDFRNYLKEHGIKHKRKPHGCGDGWFSIVDIDLQNKKIDFSCFNSETSDVLEGPPYQMSFPIDWDWNERLGLDLIDAK